jgi:hypothetical protein
MENRKSLQRALLLGAALLALGSLAIVIGAYALGKPIDHDEHQFVASAALLSREGSLPYRDYPYFHLPNLVLIYALIFRITSYLLLSARAVSAMASLGTGAILLGFAYWQFRNRGLKWQIGLGLGGILCLFASPSYRWATALSWNHDLPVFLFMLGMALGTSLAGSSRWRWVLPLAGACLGWAGGIRASFLLAVPPALAFLSLEARPEDWKRALAIASVGASFGLVPSAIFLFLSPKAFLFGNLAYVGLNTQYRVDRGFASRMDMAGKLKYLLVDFSDPVLIFATVSGILLLFFVLLGDCREKRIRARAITCAFVPLVLLFGALVPTPSWPQYFYAPIPLTLFFVLWALPHVLASRSPRAMMLVTTCLLMLLMASILSIRKGELWPRFDQGVVPLWAHRIGMRIQDAVGEYPVLTNSPILPLEGGAHVEPSLATGPFALRVAYLVSPADRTRFRIVNMEDIEMEVRERRDVAVLGHKGDMGLGYLAERFGYREVDVGANVRLWVP